MRTLLVHLSGLVGLVGLLSHLSSAASLEPSVLASFGQGPSIYVVLLLATAFVHRILAQAFLRSPAASPADTPEVSPPKEQEKTRPAAGASS